jgi:hypothetical protein
MTDAAPDLFTWADGAARRDAGMAAAAAAQERDGAGWAERAYRAIVIVALFKPEVHVDDVLAIFDEAPAHPNAWGAVWARAIRDGVIRRGTAVRESRAPRKHRHCYPVYVSLIWGGAA